jgi:hypothetical protein
MNTEFTPDELESLARIVGEVFSEIDPFRLKNFLSEGQMALGQRAYHWYWEECDGGHDTWTEPGAGAADEIEPIEE